MVRRVLREPWARPRDLAWPSIAYSDTRIITVAALLRKSPLCAMHRRYIHQYSRIIATHLNHMFRTLAIIQLTKLCSIRRSLVEACQLRHFSGMTWLWTVASGRLQVLLNHSVAQEDVEECEFLFVQTVSLSLLQWAATFGGTFWVLHTFHQQECDTVVAWVCGCGVDSST